MNCFILLPFLPTSHVLGLGTHMPTHSRVHMCASACRGQRSTWSMVPLELCTALLFVLFVVKTDRVSHETWGFLIKLSCLTTERRG